MFLIKRVLSFLSFKYYYCSGVADNRLVTVTFPEKKFDVWTNSCTAGAKDDENLFSRSLARVRGADDG